ncbi:MAG: GNAT family N-acetyltransferase [candidate division WOR-3 bacterium]
MIGKSEYNNTMSQSASELVIRPLELRDAMEIGRITISCRNETGCDAFYSLEDYEKLFDTDWLKNGTGLVLECKSTVLGYGWISVATWRLQDVISFGLFLSPRARERSFYQPLVERLLSEARHLAVNHKINHIVFFSRATDHIHPPILTEFGFVKHPVSMLGMSHILEVLPRVEYFPDMAVRAVRLPEEIPLLRRISAAAFDDPPNQGEPLNWNEDFLLIEKSDPGFKPEQIMLAEIKEEPIAYLVTFICKNLPYKAYEIVDFGVIPKWRRRGIGSILLGHALKWIKDQGAQKVLASTFSTNPAINVFWHNGFRPDHSRTYIFYTREIGL